MQPTNPYASPVATEGYARPPQTSGAFRRILNTGLHLYVTNLLPIAVLTLIVWTPLELFAAYMDYFVFDPDDFKSTFRLQQALDSFFGIVATGAIIALQDASIRGEKLSAWEALGEGFAAWPRLFWSRLLRGLLLLIAFLALIIPGLYYWARLALVEQVAVIEHESGSECIKRAHHLTTGRFWLLFGLMALAYTAIAILSLILFVPLGFFPDIDHWLLSAAISLLLDVVIHIPTSILTAAYFESLQDVNRQNFSKEVVHERTSAYLASYTDPQPPDNSTRDIPPLAPSPLPPTT